MKSGRVFPKAGIYFSHDECFGHTTRVIAVADVFKKRFPSSGNLFFIQAGVNQPLADIDKWGRVYPLPGAFPGRRNFRETLRVPGTDALERERSSMDIMTRENPDLLMTEFFPLGRDESRFEMISSLIKASRQGGVLWAVAGYPLLTGADNEWREKVLKLYQKIIIFSPSSEKEHIAGSFTRAPDRQRYLDFFQRHASKITFAGYLLPRPQVVRDDTDHILNMSRIPQGACRVAILRGGGAVYPKVIAQAIRASDLLGKEYYLTVVAGPSTTRQEWYFFSILVGEKKINNLTLIRSIGDYEGLIKKSNVCVSLASYHTSVMLLKHRKKAVLIPFEGYGSQSIQEQPARAAMLKEMIGARILPINGLTAENLAAAVKDAASSQEISSHDPKEWFEGADVLDKALTGLFER